MSDDPELTTLTAQLDQEQRKKRREVFDKYCNGQSDNIAVGDAHNAMTELGITSTLHLDSGRDAVSFEQFDRMCSSANEKRISSARERKRNFHINLHDRGRHRQPAGAASRTAEDVELMAMSAVQEEELRRSKRRAIFEAFDFDKSGTIDINELKNIMGALGVNRTPDELKEIIHQATASSSSTTSTTMTFDQFDHLFSTSRLKDIFDELDVNHRGTISRAELRIALEKSGYQASNEENYGKMIEKLSKDNSKGIGFEEFRHFFENIPLASLKNIASHWENSLFAENMSHIEDKVRRKKKRREIFDKFDHNHCGTIDINELKYIMKALGVHKTTNELQEIIHSVPYGSAAESPKELSFEQFDRLFATSRLMDVFIEIDSDRSGFISRSELQLAMEKAGFKLTEKQCNSMLSRIDKNNDNEIDFEEFRSFFEHVPLATLAAVASHWDNSMFLQNMGNDEEELERRRRRREIFNKFDLDKSGDIDINEFKNIMNALGVNKSSDELCEIIRTVAQGTEREMKTISFDQFDRLFATSRLKDVFDEVDVDKTGQISAKNLRIALQKLGHNISQRQCDEMIKKLDKDNNFKVDFEEFRSFFENIPLASLTSITSHWESSVFITDTGTNDMAPTIHHKGSGLEWWQTVLAGGCAGIMSRTITAPLEKVIITTQAGMDKGLGTISYLKSVYSRQGIRGLFAGNLLNCMRVFPTAGITCTIYLNLLAFTPAENDFDVMEPVYRLSCAGTAALVANTLTYPMDLLRARVTVQETGRTSVISHALELYKEGGSKAFFKGIRPTLLAVVPFVALQNAGIDMLRDEAAHRGLDPSPFVLLGVGACAGVLAQSVVYPLDVLRRRMQLEHNNVETQANARVMSDRTWLAMKNIVAMNGARSLYAGIIPTFVKTIPAISVVSLVTNSIIGYYKKQNSEPGSADV